MKRILISAAILLCAAAFMVIAGGSSNGTAAGTYKIELDNAFGLVTGADFKVAGVRAGTIKSIDLDPKTLHAVVTVQVTQSGYGQFRSDAYCQSRPQSLIGEYFIECQPGESGRVLKAGSTIPVSHTFSTIPADLLQNVMQMPYRERLTLIINELGAGVASRGEDLQAALQRAVPALTQTDNLLSLLANDSHTLQDLIVNSDSVITALADNSTQVQHFITAADSAATDTASQQANLQTTLQELPGFLEQLRPTLARLSTAVDANEPVLVNLDAASGQLDRLFTDLPPFSRSALPAVRSLGQASVTGKVAVQAANPTIAHLNQFAQPTPELAQNLAIVLHDLDDRSRAVEPDPRSPGGKGYTGLEALLQYVFNQAVAINTYGPFGHMLAVDGFVNAQCTGYATPSTIATNLKLFGPGYRSCYSWLGPNQPGVNEPDPSDPSACAPDPGGAPPGDPGPNTSVCMLGAADIPGAKGKAARASHNANSAAPAGSQGGSLGGGGATGVGSSGAGPGSGSSGAGGAGSAGAGGAGAGGAGGGGSGGPLGLGGTIGKVLSVLGGGSPRTGCSPSGSGSSVSGVLGGLLGSRPGAGSGTCSSANNSGSGSSGSGSGNGGSGSGSGGSGSGGGGSSGSGAGKGSGSGSGSGPGTGSGSGTGSGGPAQQLLSYLLSP